ncbi:MAG: hypothetical protein UHN41_07875, partial [Bacteroidales bacterium]|nr:hypothetical protein [Bacteroidales bacterium]
MSNFLKIILVICFLGSSVNITAQQKYADAYEKKGDEAFNKGNYTEALEHYTMGRKFLLNPVSLIYKCGEACRMLKDYDKAEYWYQKVLVEYDTLDINATFPLLYLHLAEVAKNNGNIVQAQHFLNTCLLDCPDIEIRKKAKQELNSIKWIFENNKEEENTIITNCGENVNNAFSQSGCFIINDSLMFFTSPTYKEEIENGEIVYSNIYNKVFMSFIDEDFYTPAKELIHDRVNVKNKNSANFFLDTLTQTVYFNRFTIKNGKEIHQIYYTTFKDNKWTKAKPYEPLYDKKSSNCCPVIARDEEGKAVMYFSSDRTGGVGGYDIWYIEMGNENAKPVNLGNTINTKGNEITPHYCQDDQCLYFASDYHPGYGGFDIFLSEGWLQRWKTPENLLMPINSYANDLYPFITSTSEQGYFTSNRSSVFNKTNKTCCNDIYRWDKELPKVPTQVIVEKASFNPAFDLPISLYFHNDEPNPNSNDTVTKMDYAQCYKDYRALSNSYKANCSRNLPDSLEQKAIEQMERIFVEKIDKGMEKLELLAEYIYEKLQEGRMVSLQVRGYASALHNEDYNYKLSQRRIVSLENYFRNWRSGLLRGYFATLNENGVPML